MVEWQWADPVPVHGWSCRTALDLQGLVRRLVLQLADVVVGPIERKILVGSGVGRSGREISITEGRFMEIFHGVGYFCCK